MDTIIVFFGMTENGERAVVQRIEVLAVGDSWYLVVVPLQEAGLHGGVEAGEHLALADAADVRRVRVGS